MRNDSKKTIATLNCDQVAWIKDALRRHAEVCALPYPRISRAKEVADTAFIMELCEILGLLMDDAAVANALPRELRIGVSNVNKAGI